MLTCEGGKTVLCAHDGPMTVLGCQVHGPAFRPVETVVWLTELELFNKNLPSQQTVNKLINYQTKETTYNLNTRDTR